MATITNKSPDFKLNTDFGVIEFKAGDSELSDAKWDHCSRYHEIKQRVEGSTLIVQPSAPAAPVKDDKPDGDKPDGDKPAGE